MVRSADEARPVAPSQPRSRRALTFEALALRHQIAVLERSGTRRPCFCCWDRLFWILLSWWWPGWREGLLIVKPQTVLRWRRNGWAGLWRYRSRGRWRGGRPRISLEIRQLIVRMARENFLWGAPRIHGELLMLGFKVSQATVSRYLATVNRRPGPSWRTFIRNQAIAFGHHEHPDQHSEDEYLGLLESSKLIRSVLRSLSATHRRCRARRTLMSPKRGIAFSPGPPARGSLLQYHGRNAALGRSLKVRDNRFTGAVPIRSPPYQAQVSPRAARSCPNRDVALRVDQVLKRHTPSRALL